MSTCQTPGRWGDQPDKQHVIPQITLSTDMITHTDTQTHQHTQTGTAMLMLIKLTVALSLIGPYFRKRIVPGTTHMMFAKQKDSVKSIKLRVHINNVKHLNYIVSLIICHQHQHGRCRGIEIVWTKLKITINLVIWTTAATANYFLQNKVPWWKKITVKSDEVILLHNDQVK